MEVEMPAILTIFTRSKEMDCTHPKQSTRLQNRSDPMGFYRLRLPPNFPHHMTGNPDTAVNGHRSIACCLLPVAIQKWTRGFQLLRIRKLVQSFRC
uniref:Uncharacterized protein n=1 Tax=Setaria viridis TaxID=4556 RepID=A0A4U6V360_SETVI|nr:hypothetical protein SEVIR_4G292701v2 [Setaria viridis]